MGTLQYDTDNRTWIVTASPQVLLVAKRVFAKASKHEFGSLQLSDTLETVQDLDWFMSRYPLQHLSPDYFRKRMVEARIRVRAVEEVIHHQRTQPHLDDLALPLRDYQKVAAQLCLTSGRLLLADDLGTGKAQPLTAKVLTPTGWRRMGDLQVGDAVVDPDGGHGLVTGVFPQGDLPVYRLTTKDGGSTECSDDHLWNVMSRRDRITKRSRVKPLRELTGDLRGIASKGGWCSSKWFLPNTSPVELAPMGPLPLPPYLLGVLLGDGGLKKSATVLTNSDEEVLERVRELLPDGVTLRRESKYDWRVSGDVGCKDNAVLSAIRCLGLGGCRSWEKSVPVQYLRASVENRLELLRGLMDTDGDCQAPSGPPVFNTSSPMLRDNVVELVRGLGGIASVTTRLEPKYTYKGETRIGRTAYRVYVRLPFNPFHLRRKATNWKMPYMAKAIDSIEALGYTAPMQCISVSTKRSLYVTDDHLVTHNTGSSIGVLTGDGTTPCVVVTATHLVHQWQRELERFLPGLRSHVVKTGTPYDMTRVAEGRVRPKNPRPFPDVIIISYSKLAGWADTLGEYVKYIIFDECQELRSGKSTPTPAKYSAARYLASKAKYCMGLSATPVYGYGGEFFSVLDGIHPGSVGSYEEFQREWCSTSYGDKPKIKEPKVFGEWLYSTGMMLRRTRADVKRELPPFQAILQEVDTDSAALDSVSKNCAELAKLILGDTVLARGAAMDAAQEFSNQLRQATGIAKAPYVADFVRMVAEGGEKVVLFAWHRAVYDIYLEKLADLKPMLYTGSESVAAKEAAKKAFTEGDCQVLIVSLRSGSGLDGLQHICKTIVFGELDWSPGVMNQCEGRVYRDGQENPVVAYYLIASAGADPSIVDVLGLKKQQLVGVIDPNKDLVESLAVDEDRVRKLARDYLARKDGAAA